MIKRILSVFLLLTALCAGALAAPELRGVLASYGADGQLSGCGADAQLLGRGERKRADFAARL